MGIANFIDQVLAAADMAAESSDMDGGMGIRGRDGRGGRRRNCRRHRRGNRRGRGGRQDGKGSVWQNGKGAGQSGEGCKAYRGCGEGKACREGCSSRETEAEVADDPGRRNTCRCEQTECAVVYG